MKQETISRAKKQLIVFHFQAKYAFFPHSFLTWIIRDKLVGSYLVTITIFEVQYSVGKFPNDYKNCSYYIMILWF